MKRMDYIMGNVNKMRIHKEKFKVMVYNIGQIITNGDTLKM